MAVDVETQRSRDGLKVLMGSALANTNVHIVSAPMATWLVRNDSRFGFMDEKGSVFVKSQVANYIFRPQELRVCL